MKDIISHTKKPVFSLEKNAIYESALEVFTLSRKLTQHTYNTPKNNDLYPEEIHLTEQITQTSLSLPFSIAQATVTNDYIKKLAFRNTIHKRISLLKKTYSRLKNISIKKTKDIHLMGRAINQFENKFENWSTAITRQN